MITKSFRLFKIQLIILFAICLLGYFVTTYSNHFKGIGIGLAVSFYCMWLLSRKIERVTENVINGGKRFVSLGMVSRMAAAVLGALIMYRLGNSLIMWTLAVGILSGYFLLVINLAYYSHKSAKEEVEAVNR